MFTFAFKTKIINLLEEEIWIDTDAKQLKRIWRLNSNQNTEAGPHLGNFTLELLKEGRDREVEITNEIKGSCDFVLDIIDSGNLAEEPGIYITHELKGAILTPQKPFDAFSDQVVYMFTGLKNAGIYKRYWDMSNILVDATNQKLYTFCFVMALHADSAKDAGIPNIGVFDLEKKLRATDFMFNQYDPELPGRIRALYS
jgi:hypothetical protein